MTINFAYSLSNMVVVTIVVVNIIVGIMFEYCNCRTGGRGPLTIRRAGNCLTYQMTLTVSRTNNYPNEIL